MKTNVKKIVTLAVLSGVAVVLMATFSLPILPSAPHLRFEPGEIPGILAACLFGPVAGVTVNLVKDLLYLLLRARSIFGPLGDLLASVTFAFVVGLVYKRFPTSKGLVLGCILGTVVRVLVMIPGNLVILRLQFGLGTQEVMKSMVPAIIPFNLLKSGLNSLGAIVLFKLIAKRIPLFWRSGDSS